jgi:hypothetical protein
MSAALADARKCALRGVAGQGLLGGKGKVVGLDLDPMMLEVVRTRVSADVTPVEFYEGRTRWSLAGRTGLRSIVGLLNACSRCPCSRTVNRVSRSSGIG